MSSHCASSNDMPGLVRLAPPSVASYAPKSKYNLCAISIKSFADASLALCDRLRRTQKIEGSISTDPICGCFEADVIDDRTHAAHFASVDVLSRLFMTGEEIERRTTKINLRFRFGKMFVHFSLR